MSTQPHVADGCSDDEPDNNNMARTDSTDGSSGTALFDADFTYPFLKGLPCCGLRRPRRIDIPLDALNRMTNMERQFWEIKKKYFDVVIFFKKGKFYELYDTDAVIGNREFGLKMAAGQRGHMRMSGVPEQSFYEWSRLFIFKGYKIGKVEQFAVEEKGGDAKCVPRSLVAILTRGTTTDPAMLGTASEPNYVIALELVEGGAIDVVAIDISRRLFRHSTCSTSIELATMFHQIDPTEVVMGPGLVQCDSSASVATGDQVRQLLSTIAPDCVVEDINSLETEAPSALNGVSSQGGFSSPAHHVARRYFRYLLIGDDVLPDHLSSSYEPNAFVEYTAHRHLAAPPCTLPQPSLSVMQLERDDPGLTMDASAIESLELTANLRDGTTNGSLLQYFTGDGRRLSTPGGHRLMRQWLLRPSANEQVIIARQQAVALLAGVPAASLAAAASDDPVKCIGKDTSLMLLWKSSVNRTTTTTTSSAAGGRANLRALDLERLLGRVSDIANIDLRVSYADPLVMYTKYLATLDDALQGFLSVALFAEDLRKWLDATAAIPNPAPGLSLLRELAEPCSVIKKPLEQLLSSTFRRERIFGPDGGFVLPVDHAQCPQYFQACDAIREAEEDLSLRLKTYERLLGSPLSYCDLGKDVCLLEVPAKLVKVALDRIGASELRERARTAKTVKFQVVPAASAIANLKRATTQKQVALVAILKGVATELCRFWPQLFAANMAISYVDCLAALADLGLQASALAPICLPRIQQSSCSNLTLAAVHHPIVLHQTGRCVPNSVSLDASSGRVLVLTGPNMAGKSTLMRSVALAVIAAQLGGFVPAERCVLDGPVDRIFTRIGARDATCRGASTLHVELSEMAAIHRLASPRSLCLVDELGRGTSTHDGYAIAYASLTELSRSSAGAPLSLFSTHYHGLALDIAHQQQSSRREHAAVEGAAAVQLGYMDFHVSGLKRSRDEDGEERISFLYQLVPGVCSRSYGVEVALRAAIPKHVVDTARRLSEALRTVAGDLELVAFANDIAEGRHAEAAKRARQLLAVL